VGRGNSALNNKCIFPYESPASGGSNMLCKRESECATTVEPRWCECHNCLNCGCLSPSLIHSDEDRISTSTSAPPLWQRPPQKGCRRCAKRRFSVPYTGMLDKQSRDDRTSGKRSAECLSKFALGVLVFSRGTDSSDRDSIFQN
jgi:hypothetical protein